MMMKNKVELIEKYQFKSSDNLLLDTNIWVYLYLPQISNNNSLINIYSTAFKRILEAKSKIYIDALIVSEFINSYVRIQHKLISPGKGFKQFRNSPEFKKIAAHIAADVTQVLKHCIRIESGFEILPINELIREFEEGNSDFNDQILVALCKNKNLTFLTHDIDFKGHNVQIITANNKLL